MGALYDPKLDDHLDRRVAAIAAGQHGVFSRRQAVASGATKGAIAWRLKVGRWQVVHPRVYRLAGSVPTWRQHAMSCCLYLGEGAVVSHRAAARLSGLVSADRAPIEISAPRRSRRRPPAGVKVHWRADPMPDEDLTTIDRIPVTRPARTLLDMAATESEDFVERCLDDALRTRRVRLDHLERWLAARPRSRGRPTLLAMIAARKRQGVTESELEASALRAIRKAGLPPPVLQYVVRDRGRFVARVDLAYPEQRVAIEIDGFRHHDHRRTFDRERARGNHVVSLGWQLLRITAQHLLENPDAVTGWIRGALRRAGR